jgi:hypothetical protein
LIPPNDPCNLIDFHGVISISRIITQNKRVRRWRTGRKMVKSGRLIRCSVYWMESVEGKKEGRQWNPQI